MSVYPWYGNRGTYLVVPDVETSRLGLLPSSCRLRRSLAADYFCLAEICWLAALLKTRRSTVINLHRNVPTLRHVWHTSPVTTKWWGRGNGHRNSLSTVLQTHSTSQQTMVTKRERRYNGYYPTDAAAAVLVSNETHWYMLPIKLLCPHNYTSNVC